MKKLQTFSEPSLPVLHQYPPAPCEVTGQATATIVAPADSPLRLIRAHLVKGAALQFPTNHGDSGIYVVSGELRVVDRSCVAGGAVIVEAGVVATVDVLADSEILHLWSDEIDVPSHSGHLVHVVGPGGWFRTQASDNVNATWYCDSTCPSCRISLFLVSSKPRPVSPGPRHSHSADELIVVLSGELRLGAHAYGPGTSLFVPADVRYALSHGVDGAIYLNYRKEASEQTYVGAGRPREPVAEGGLVRAGIEVNDVVNVEILS